VTTVKVRTSTSLLTLDEARAALTASAARCLSGAKCDPATLVAMLWGLAVGRTPEDHTLSEEHKFVLESICDAGHGWILAEELSGIISATGLCEGERTNVDCIAAQVPQQTSDGGAGDRLE
jgi:hypothetical protein